MVKFRRIPPAAATNQIAGNARIPPAAATNQIAGNARILPAPDLQKNKNYSSSICMILSDKLKKACQQLH